MLPYGLTLNNISIITLLISPNQDTVCPRSLVYIYIVSVNKKLDNHSWKLSIYRNKAFQFGHMKPLCNNFLTVSLAIDYVIDIIKCPAQAYFVLCACENRIILPCLFFYLGPNKPNGKCSTDVWLNSTMNGVGTICPLTLIILR